MTTQATHLDASPPPAQGVAVNRGERNMNPAGMGLFALLREDLRTHDGKIFEQGFWAVAVHRLGNWRMGLPKILRMPYTLSRGIYYWPFAYDVASIDDLTQHERELLAPLGPLESVFVEGTGYLGWRAAIQPDGTWVLFIAGD